MAMRKLIVATERIKNNAGRFRVVSDKAEKFSVLDTEKNVFVKTGVSYKHAVKSAVAREIIEGAWPGWCPSWQRG